MVAVQFCGFVGRRLRPSDIARRTRLRFPLTPLQMLSEVLASTKYAVNVTASCANTSVIGNALDRGVGFHRQRSDDLAALEVVVGNGDLLRVGAFWNLRWALGNGRVCALLGRRW